MQEKDLELQLRSVGLRPTRQRIALASLIFSGDDCHICAENLFEKTVQSHIPISLATIYNTLHQFTQAGLLRIIAVEGTKTWFDTNTSDHHHFYIDATNEIIDIPHDEENQPVVQNLPQPPQGMEISNVDLIIRVRAKPH